MHSGPRHAESAGNGALKLFSDENTHMMLWRENLPAAYELLRPGGWAALAREPTVQALLDTAQSLSRRFDFRETATPELSTAIARRSRTIARRDTALVDRLIRLTAASLAEADLDAADWTGRSIDAVDRAQPDLSLEAATQQLATRLRNEISRDAQRRATPLGSTRAMARRTLGDAGLVGETRSHETA
jgi:hypothetical protein